MAKVMERNSVIMSDVLPGKHTIMIPSWWLFWGSWYFQKKGGKISMNLAAVITTFEKKPNITLVPMILADIYLAFTICKDGKRLL